MQKLLNFEFRKLFRQKSFYICIAVAVGMLVLSVVLLKVLENQLAEMPEMEGVGTIAQNAAEVVLTSISGSSFTLILAVLIALIVCEDFSSQTIKNIYARGYSRESVYFSKLVSSFVATTIMFLCVFAVSFVVGIVCFGFTGSFDGKFFACVGSQYITILAYASLFFMISFLIKKAGGAIACNIIGPTAIDLILTLLTTAFKQSDTPLSQFWVGAFITDLGSTAVEVTRILTCVGLSALYVAIFVGLGAVLTRRIDIKD